MNELVNKEEYRSFIFDEIVALCSEKTKAEDCCNSGLISKHLIRKHTKEILMILGFHPAEIDDAIFWSEIGHTMKT